jgi:hypothetical protein
VTHVAGIMFAFRARVTLRWNHSFAVHEPSLSTRATTCVGGRVFQRCQAIGRSARSIRWVRRRFSRSFRRRRFVRSLAAGTQ